MAPTSSLTILEAMESPSVFGHFFPRIETWANWRIFLKAIYNLPMTEEEAAFFQHCTARPAPPEQVDEVYCISGRRSGKSKIASLIVCYEALYGSWTRHVIPGERNWIFCIGVDTAQAGIVYDQVRSMLSRFPDLIERESNQELWLQNGCSIAVKPAFFRSVRGYSISCCVLDELAFLKSETSTNPAAELVTALLPAMTDDSKLIGISTPFLKRGLLWEKFRDHYGCEESDQLVWRSSTAEMNPTFSSSRIAKLIGRDRQLFQPEYLAEFREYVEGAFPEELVELYCSGSQLSPKRDLRYFAFVDMSGGRGDSMTLSIAHNEGEKVIVDLLRERAGKETKPEEAAKEFAAVCKQFGIFEVTSDRYGSEWVAAAYRKHGVAVRYSDFSKSELYLELLPMLISGNVVLLDDATLKRQLIELQRKGKTIDHMPDGADDVANSVAGVVVHAASQQRYMFTPEEQAARLPQLSEHRVPEHEHLALTRGRRAREVEEECRKEMHDFMVAGGCNRIVK